MAGRATRIGALISLLLLGSPAAFGYDAIGVLHSTCDLYDHGYQLELEVFRGRRLQEPVVCDILGEAGLAIFRNRWIEVGCRNAKFSRIQVVHMSRDTSENLSALSGGFVVVYADGHKLKGSFRATYIQPPQLLICQ
jgi:hypothetical protein